MKYGFRNNQVKIISICLVVLLFTVAIGVSADESAGQRFYVQDQNGERLVDFPLYVQQLHQSVDQRHGFTEQDVYQANDEGFFVLNVSEDDIIVQSAHPDWHIQDVYCDEKRSSACSQKQYYLDKTIINHRVSADGHAAYHVVVAPKDSVIARQQGDIESDQSIYVSEAAGLSFAHPREWRCIRNINEPAFGWLLRCDSLGQFGGWSVDTGFGVDILNINQDISLSSYLDKVYGSDWRMIDRDYATAGLEGIWAVHQGVEIVMLRSGSRVLYLFGIRDFKDSIDTLGVEKYSDK